MTNENQLLAALGPDEQRRLLEVSERVPLTKGRVLYDIGASMSHAYFPTSGLLSLLVVTPGGGTVEVGMVGNEGFAGLPILLFAEVTPYVIVVQESGAALRIRASALRAHLKWNAPFQDVLLRYTHGLFAEVCQCVVCHRFHTALQRLCRWLLTVRDRMDTDHLELTHEHLSHVLGAPRPYVTAAAVELQNAGAIHCRHGKITILDRKRLERSACDCYRLARDDAHGSRHSPTM